MQSIDRIEVISGPGGTMWGTNAVNGVINIITKRAAEAQGALISAGAGNGASEFAARYGGTFGADGAYRLNARHYARGHTETAAGVAKTDAWRKTHGGFRIDWKNARDQWSVLGHAYDGRVGQPLPGTISITGVTLALDTIAISGGNLSARWQRSLGEESNFTLQADLERSRRVVPPTFAETLVIGDIQARHLLAPIGRHVLAWGAEYRQSRDRLVNSPYVAFLPARLTQRWMSLFAQDDIALQKNLKLTAGARLERTSYTGNEFLPTLRMAWKLADDRLLWAAASRTVRAPSRLERDTFVPAYGRNVSYSATLYRSSYDHLRTQEIAASRTFLFFANGMEGTTSGVEAWASAQPSRNWRVSAGFNVLKEDLELKRGSNDLTAVDARLGWHPRRTLDLSFTLQNLTDPGHGEFTPISTRTEIGRSWFLEVSWGL